ncbi:MAG: hypothetical protein HY787_18590 [Deltaproteobacteria bacterium]|nr:hypothetical protein [Deltaproteobacteria bacterium]
MTTGEKNSDRYSQGEGNREYDFDKNKKGNFLYNLGNLAGKTAVGLGVGITAGVGVMAAIAVAEITIPAAIIFNALGLTGGALGFLHGTRSLKK